MSEQPKSLGPYRVLEPLSVGGMGVIYKAEHQKTGQRVALKTVKLTDAAQLQGLRREIHALARLRHPGIVRILDEGVEGGLPWYAMELLEGLSLNHYWAKIISSKVEYQLTAQIREHLTPPTVVKATVYGTLPTGDIAAIQTTMLPQAQQGQPDPAAGKPEQQAQPQSPNQPRKPAASGHLQEALTIVRRLCAPLAYLHGEGLVHRDLKPDNILIRPNGQPVLVDFGIASWFGGQRGREILEFTLGLLGTVHYVAPEQIRGELLDARADLYALGCILYRLVAGRLPFENKETGEILRLHMESEPERPSQLVDGVSPDLERLLLKLLRKSPRDRLGYATDIAAQLARLGADPSPLEGMSNSRSYLYRARIEGRKTELGFLRKKLDYLRLQTGSIVLIGGESGIGKTRFALEVGREAGNRRYQVLLGECVPKEDRGGSEGLQPFRKPLQALADQCRERGYLETERIFGSRLQSLAKYEPSLASLPGYAEEAASAVEQPPEASWQQLFRDLAETLRTVALERPLLLVLDDLHWADELTLGFLAHVAQEKTFKNQPVLLLGTYRAEEVDDRLGGLLAHGTTERLELKALDEDALGNILMDMLALPIPPMALSRFLIRRAEGNPFFIAEYLKAAVDEGLLWRDEDGLWQMAQRGNGLDSLKEEPLRLPGTLQDLVHRRLERLSPRAWQLAETAAIVGRQSNLALLKTISGLEDVQFLLAFDELVRRQIIEESEPGQARFLHDKLREIIYEGIALAQRPPLHRAVAEQMVVLFGPHSASAVLAYHWEEAGDLERAREAYLEAATHARETFAMAKAIRLYRAYLRLIQQPTPERIRAQTRLGHLLHFQGSNRDAWLEYMKALADARQIGDLRGQALALLGQTSLHHLSGRLKEGMKLLEEALPLAREVGDRSEEARILCNIAMITIQLGQQEQAKQLSSQALALVHEVGDTFTEAQLLNVLTLWHWKGNRLNEALETCQQALELVRRIQETRLEIVPLINLTLIRQSLGLAPEEISKLLQEALLHCRKLSYRHGEGFVLSRMGELQLSQGHGEEAKPLLEEALGLHRQLNAREDLASTLRGMARWHRLCALDAAEALARIQEAESIARQLQEPEALSLILCEAGHVTLAQGRSAQSQLEEASRLLRPPDQPTPRKELAQSLERLERAQAAFGRGELARLFQGELLEDLPPPLLPRQR